MITTDVPGIFLFTFTPDEGQCASASTIEIEVEERVVPLFDQIGPLSQNSTAPLLPPISLNGITGTWDPSFIDTSVPGTYTYTFTPDEEAIIAANEILTAYTAHQKAGRGAFAIDGKMIDAPVVKSAQNVIERARAAGRI